MIKSVFLTQQIEKTRQERRTSPFLRRLVFKVVDAIAREHYGDSYPTRCFQCSAATMRLLEGFGVRSRLRMGAVCIVEVSEEGLPKWGGFWDKDHHVWLMTEHGELVDLSVGVLHLHPANRRAAPKPGPAIWWTDAGIWPPVIRYLPDTEVHALNDADDAADLARFEALVSERLAALVRDETVDGITFGLILDGIPTLETLTTEGDPWASGAYAIQRRGIPFPPWIRQREADLMRAYEAGRTAPSHLRTLPSIVSAR